MKFSTTLSRTIISVLITLVFLLHTMREFDHSFIKVEIPLVNKIEHIVYDLRLRLNTANTIDPRIIIVDIDENSLAAEGRWPWSRDKLAHLVDILFDQYKIDLLGFDIVFSEADTSSGLQLLENLAQNELLNNTEFNRIVEKHTPNLKFDNLFANSFNNRAIVLGYYFSNTGNINPNSSLPPPSGQLDKLPKFNPLQATGYGANLAILQKHAGAGGYFNNQTVDSDGSYRRLPLVTNFDGKLYETLSLAMYRRLLQQANIEYGITQGYGFSNGSRLESINVESLSIPVNENAVALVPYRGKQGSFPYVSATNVLNGTADPALLANKIILMGTTAAGLLDLRTTPVQNIYPGVEVHANLISAMLDNSFKSKPAYMLGVEVLELLLLAAFIILLYPKLGSISAVITFVVIISLMLIANIYCWNTLDIDNFLATPLIMLFSLFLVQIYFGYFLESKKKNKLGKLFGQYIPSEIVSEMSQSEHDFSLKGQSKDMTVLFSDVRGFTTISESMSPEALCDLINEILTPITNVIHHHNGTIDKYIGDAVMAFWGAPLDDANHASNAIKAALDFIPALEEINKSFEQKNWPHIDIGIGLNTGIMSVGNMGSEFRMAYTVMGDSVNLGARLEGLTKQYGVPIIVSEYTKRAAADYAYLEIDQVRVKGKSKPVTIYQPLGILSEISPETEQLIKETEDAFYFYHIQQWSQAKLLFGNLKRQYPELSLFKLYLSRIKEYELDPPGSDWDGVFTHQTK